MKLAPIPPPYYTTEKKKNNGLKWAILSIAALVIITIIYFGFIRKKDDVEVKEEKTIIKEASEIKNEEYKKEEIKIPTIETNEEITEVTKRELELPSSFIANTNYELLSEEYLYKTEIAKIKLIRDEIYARHGYIFQNKETQKYFESKTWYKPNPEYSDELLNDMEIENLKIISTFLNEEQEDENDEIDKWRQLL